MLKPGKNTGASRKRRNSSVASAPVKPAFIFGGREEVPDDLCQVAAVVANEGGQPYSVSFFVPTSDAQMLIANGIVQVASVKISDKNSDKFFASLRARFVSVLSRDVIDLQIIKNELDDIASILRADNGQHFVARVLLAQIEIAVGLVDKLNDCHGDQIKKVVLRYFLLQQDFLLLLVNYLAPLRELMHGQECFGDFIWAAADDVMKRYADYAELYRKEKCCDLECLKMADHLPFYLLSPVFAEDDRGIIYGGSMVLLRGYFNDLGRRTRMDTRRRHQLVCELAVVNKLKIAEFSIVAEDASSAERNNYPQFSEYLIPFVPEDYSKFGAKEKILYQCVVATTVVSMLFVQFLPDVNVFQALNFADAETVIDTLEQNLGMLKMGLSEESTYFQFLKKIMSEYENEYSDLMSMLKTFAEGLTILSAKIDALESSLPPQPSAVNGLG